MALSLAPLRPEHLPEAATLVCAHVNRLRTRVPLAPERYERPDEIIALLRPLAEVGQGAVATEGDRLVGLLAYERFPFKGQRAAMSAEWAHAAEGERPGAIYQQLYRHLAARWLDESDTLHLMGTLSHDRAALDVWFWQGFGLLAVDAVRSLAWHGPAYNEGIRRATADDADALHALGQGLMAHLRAAPVFLRGEGESLADWERSLADKGRAVFIATQIWRQPVGYLRIGPANEDACTLIRDPGTASITGAYVAPEARGSGRGLGLLVAALAWAREAGYARAAVDFESANVEGAGFWMRHFQPVVMSGMRWVQG
jgi:ribosomal protein S18 acetylase RimI-like enzyme